MVLEFEDLRQSDEWAKYIRRLGWRNSKLKTSARGGSASGRQNSNLNIYIRELPLIGSVAKIQRPSVIPPVEEIDEIAKKYRALFVKLEPRWNEKSRMQDEGFEKDNWPLLPSKTIWVDLTPAEEEILGRFSKDARYSIRRSHRLGVEVRSSKDLESFYNLFRETGRRKNFWVPPFTDLTAKAEAFKEKFILILAYHHSAVVAGALILFHDSVAYYHHAASNLAGRRVSAPYLVVWEAVRIAKERGCHTLDLEGIYDPRYRIYRRWKNISVFKRKFGGKEVDYPGSGVRYYRLPVRLLFKVGSVVAALNPV